MLIFVNTHRFLLILPSELSPNQERMSVQVKLRKGANIKLKGVANRVKVDANASDVVALKPSDFHGVIPKLILREGAKVKAFVFFRGRSIVFKEKGEILLLKFAQALEEHGVVEQMPKLEGKRMTMFIAPKKKK